MKNFLNKIFLTQMSIAAYAKYLLVAFSVIGLLGVISAGASTATGAASTAQSAICSVFNSVRDVIFILGLTLMILGGALYAGANIMPSQSKGGFQGYGMSMIIGGVIGVAIAVAAPFILNLILQAGGASNVISSGLTNSGSVVTNAGCPTS
jgi:hypothetical protein